MRIYLAIITFLFSTVMFAQTHYFVKQNWQGSGDAWYDATGDLVGVLAKAKKGDVIWVGKGTYVPHKNDRNKSFQIPNGVKVYGGFNGFENNLKQRDFKKNPTILSGEIGAEGISDNSYSVVTTAYVDETTIIDGFIIQDGFAGGNGEIGNPSRAGGGWFNNGYQAASNPTIRNCYFKNNRANEGGAFYNNGKKGEANPTFENCVFDENIADLDGGAIYNDGRKKGNACPSFLNCTIKKNRANYGGGMYNYGSGGNCESVLTKTKVEENKALIRGGGILNMNINGKATSSFEDSNFRGNISPKGSNRFSMR